MNNLRLFIPALVLLALFQSRLSPLAHPAVASPDKGESQESDVRQSKDRDKILHRVDFTISGTSCATCLLRIERELKKAPGVIKVAVSVLAPYPAVVIFDAKKTRFSEILNAIKNETAVASNPTEVQIDRVPAVLLPPLKSVREQIVPQK